MRVAAALSLATLLSPAFGQAPRLVDSIESPVAYLCLEAMPASDAAARTPGPVQRLLADPSLDALFGVSDGASATSSSSGRALALVRGVLARRSGELELALTGVLPSAGQPMLILRARLQRAEADRLQLALDGDELAEPARQLGSRTTYRLRGERDGREGTGRDVELALVGADLIVGNDSTAMREVLAPARPATSATPVGTVLSAQPRFQAMRQRLPATPGSLWLYGDWPRLRDRLESSMTGVPGWLLGSSGLGSARAVMVSVAAAQADFTATLLLDFEQGAIDRPGMKRRGPDIDGWFAAAEPVPARLLLPELPASGLGGLVLSVDLASIARRSRDSAHVLRQLADGFTKYGLDFERNVLARLGTRGTVQLHVGQLHAGRGTAAVTEVTSVWSLRTKNKKAAGDLFADLRRVAEAEGIGRVLPAKEGKERERRPFDLLEVRHGDASMFLAAHDDMLLLAAHAETLDSAVEDARRAGRPRQKRGESAATTIQTIGGDEVAGLFDLDLEPLFEQLAAAFAAAGARLDLSALPKRHVGYLDLQRRDGGTVVRVSVLSSR